MLGWTGFDSEAQKDKNSWNLFIFSGIWWGWNSHKNGTLRNVFLETDISLFILETFCNYPTFDSTHCMHQVDIM